MERQSFSSCPPVQIQGSIMLVDIIGKINVNWNYNGEILILQLFGGILICVSLTGYSTKYIYTHILMYKKKIRSSKITVLNVVYC